MLHRRFRPFRLTYLWVDSLADADLLITGHECAEQRLIATFLHSTHCIVHGARCTVKHQKCRTDALSKMHRLCATTTVPLVVFIGRVRAVQAQLSWSERRSELH
eukprot:163010-Amphidinium_carterae.1